MVAATTRFRLRDRQELMNSTHCLVLSAGGSSAISQEACRSYPFCVAHESSPVSCLCFRSNGPRWPPEPPVPLTTVREDFIAEPHGTARSARSMVLHFSSAPPYRFPKNGHQTFGLGSVFGASRDSPALLCPSAGIATVAPLW